jgi:hypothetical protein
MMIKKLFAILFVAALLMPTMAIAKNNNDDRNGASSAELKQAAQKLLAEVARESGQFNAPENRVRAATIAAGLMWEQDEKAARALFENALGELRNLFAAITPPEVVEEMTRAEKADHFTKRYFLANLRREFVESLAERDPQSALAAIAALKIKVLDEYDPLVADQLELEVSSLIARKDREKSYAVAKRQLDANGLNYQFLEALKKLHKADSGLAADLAKDALAKVKTEKIRNPDAPKTDQPKGIEFYKVCHFVSALSEMTRSAARDKTKKMQPPLSAAEMKELVEIVAEVFLTAKDAPPTAISQVMPEITVYAPATAQRVRQKIGAENSKQLDKIVESQQFYTVASEISVDEMVKRAESSAPDVRDQHLAVAAFKALEEGDAVKAQTIAERVKDRANHGYLFEQIKEALPLAKAKRGDTAEVKKTLAAQTSDREKAKILTAFAATFAAKGDTETARKLLDESLALLPANPKNYEELESVVRFAEVYSLAAPERAFEILENAVAATDAYVSAGIKLDEFYLARAVKENELLFDAMNHHFSTHLPNPHQLLKNLARADFARTVALADRFQRPEIRRFVRLRLAEAVLDAKAAEKLKRTRERAASEEDGDV